MDKVRFLTAEQLSRRWGGKPTVGTLTVWRSQGEGPEYHKIGGAVKYSIEDIEKFERQSKED